MTENTVPDRAADYQGKAEKITHAPQIANLLRRVKDQKVLLSVHVPGHEGVFNSLLLDVNPERNLILLDELNPRSMCEGGAIRHSIRLVSKAAAVGCLKTTAGER